MMKMEISTVLTGLIASIVPTVIGMWAIGIYLLLGLIGIPVFASSAAGLAAIFGPTGGYLWGFFLYILVVGLCYRREQPLCSLIIGNLLGAFLQLVAGAAWLMVVAKLSWLAAYNAGVLPFLVPAVIKIVLVVVVARAIVRRLPARFNVRS